LSRTYGKSPTKKGFVSGGFDSVPPGAQLLPTAARYDYEIIPFLVYYPGPHDTITILRSKSRPHDWLVCGWYLGTYREGADVKGLLYKRVLLEADREVVLVELKKHDKEASPRFGL
jgi:hypothetical protein